MSAEVHVEFAGLTAEAVKLIEGLRRSPADTKSEILVRALAPLQCQAKKHPSSGEGDSASAPKVFDYKEGIRLPVGEKLFLFLSRYDRHAGRPDATGEIREDGFYMEGERIEPSHGRPFQPAMETIQRQKGHFSKTTGRTVSLSAISKWCVLRNGEYIPLLRLKDPKLKRTRGKRS